VYDDHVVSVHELGRIALGLADVLVPFAAPERVAGALQAVVDGLGHVEEAFVAADQAPLGVQPEIAQKRHLGAEDLGHSAAVGRGVEVQDAQAAERLGQPAELGDGVGARRLDVVGERRTTEIDGLEHALIPPACVRVRIRRRPSRRSVVRR
jgi:hypothetical protein